MINRLAGKLPEPAFRERNYAGHGNEDVSEWYSAEQLRERDAAIVEACAKACEQQAARWGDDRAKYVALECAAALRTP